MSEDKEADYEIMVTADSKTSEAVERAIGKGFFKEYMRGFFAGEGYHASNIVGFVDGGKVKIQMKVSATEADRLNEAIQDSLGERILKHLGETPLKWI